MVGRSSPFGEKPFPKTVAEVGTLSRRIADQIRIDKSKLPLSHPPSPLGYGATVINGSHPDPLPNPGVPKWLHRQPELAARGFLNELGKPYAAKSYEGDGGRVRSRSLLRWREEFPWLWAIDIGKAASKTWAIWSTDWRTWQDGHL